VCASLMCLIDVPYHCAMRGGRGVCDMMRCDQNSIMKCITASPPCTWKGILEGGGIF